MLYCGMNKKTANIVIESSEVKNMVRAMAEDILSSSRELNNTLTAGGINPTFQAHYVNTQTGAARLVRLIEEILREHGAAFTAGVEYTELRGVAVARSLYTHQIVEEVQRRFTDGTTRYPAQSVSNGLTTYNRNPKTGKRSIGKIDLSKHEDAVRPCKMPRCKWYFILPEGA